MRTLTAVVALAASLPCQQAHRTAHPQETLQDGNGDLSPLGCLSATAFTEARTQILLRSEELPGPGALLVGIEVHCQDTLSLDYASLEMDAFPTRATSLSVNFADNIRAPVTELLRATHVAVDYDATRWTSVPGSGTYLHDGVSGLVIEVRKVVDPASARFATMSTSLNPARSDRPGMVCSFGGPGSGASHAATAQTVSTPLALRLIWINAPTLRLLGDPAASGNQFGLGGSVVQTIEGGRGAFVAEFIGTSFFSPPQALPSVEGQWLVDGSLAFGFGFLPATGHEERRLAIPNDHGLVGLHVTYQAGTIETTGRAQFSNAADHFINP